MGFVAEAAAEIIAAEAAARPELRLRSLRDFIYHYKREVFSCNRHFLTQ